MIQLSKGEKMKLPDKYNYIGVFLTFRCRMGCSYCINRHGDFAPRKEISVSEWVKILSAIPTRNDLPISLQGGEPTEYPDFYDLVKELHLRGKKIDLLTNGCFDVKEFIYRTEPKMFKRRAPYASIRFSFHQKTNGITLLKTVQALKKEGYSVGIWGLDHPDMKLKNSMMQNACDSVGIDFRMKEFLDATHGTYKYPKAVSGQRQRKAVWCYPSELLFAPNGEVFPCHHFLYSNSRPFAAAKNTDSRSYRVCMCHDFGLCNPCDVKLKTNRLQQGGHCSVKIEEVTK